MPKKEERFIGRIGDALHADPFDLATAEALSIEIHNAEIAGYDISDDEDDAWGNLSDKIITERLRQADPKK